jgi:hypothetical protein
MAITDPPIVPNRMEAHMESIVGTWRLVKREAKDEAGISMPSAVKGAPMGVATFNSGGRMIVVLGDGNASAPDPTVFSSYCGTYTFDGSKLVTTVDGASEPRLREPQVRRAEFRDGLMVLHPPASMIAGAEIRFEMTWVQIASE